MNTIKTIDRKAIFPHLRSVKSKFLSVLASIGPAVHRLGGVLLLTSALLLFGCVTTTQEDSTKKMSAAEKRMAAELAKITKGMTKDQVKEILGKPTNSEKSGAWQYYVNRAKGQGTITTVGTPTGRMADTVAVTSRVNTTQWDAVALVYFSKDRVTKLRFMQQGFSGYCLTLIK